MRYTVMGADMAGCSWSELVTDDKHEAKKVLDTAHLRYWYKTVFQIYTEDADLDCNGLTDEEEDFFF